MRLTALRHDSVMYPEALEFPEFLLEAGEQRAPGTYEDEAPRPLFTVVWYFVGEIISITFG